LTISLAQVEVVRELQR